MDDGGGNNWSYDKLLHVKLTPVKLLHCHTLPTGVS